MWQYEPHLSKYPNHVTEHIVHGHTTVWGGRDHKDSLVSLTHLECVDHVWVSLELALHGWNTESKYWKYIMSQGNTQNQSTESMSCLKKIHRIKVLICRVGREFLYTYVERWLWRRLRPVHSTLRCPTLWSLHPHLPSPCSGSSCLSPSKYCQLYSKQNELIIIKQILWS